MRSLYEMSEWVRAETDERLHALKRKFLLAATAMGQSGNLETKLVRLMIWIGTSLPSKAAHSGLAHPEEILLEGSGWCDQHCRILRYFAWNMLDVDGRDIAVYHTDGSNGHTVTELLYQERWHLFDAHVDHQAVYHGGSDGHILSYDELVANPAIVTREQHWWRGSNGEGKEGFYNIAGGARARRDFPITHTTEKMRAPWRGWLI